MVTTTRTVPLLDVDDVIEQLGLVRSIDVHRLIAKGLLKGQKTPNGKWKVMSAELDKYVAAGMDDAKPRNCGNDAKWFVDRNTTAVAQKFENAVKIEMERSWPQQVRDLKPGEHVVQLKATINPTIRGLMSAAVSNASFDNADETEMFRTAVMTYAVIGTRLQAMEIIHKLPLKAAPKTKMERLFESPEMFSDISQRAVAKFFARAISVEKRYPPIEGSRNQTFRQVRMSLLNSDMFSNADIARIIRLAF